MAKTRRTTSARQEADQDEFAGSPLFESSSDIAYIAVSRDDPEEGFLGKLPPHATEGDLRKKFGGGTYTLTARNQGGKHVKGGHLSVTIAGDPIFQSRAAELKWRKAQGLADPDSPTKTGEKPMSLGEIMMLMQTQSEKARQDSREMFLLMQQLGQQSHQQQLELLRADAERRDRESREREERREREAREERERNREFMQTMIQLVKTEAKEGGGGVEQVKMLMAGIQLAKDLGGGDGADDPLLALASNLPGVMAEARRMLTADGGKKENPKKPADDDENVTLQGELADKARLLIERIKKQGRDPAQVLARTFDVLSGNAKKAKALPAKPKTRLKRRVRPKLLHKKGRVHRGTSPAGGKRGREEPQGAPNAVSKPGRADRVSAADGEPVSS